MCLVRDVNLRLLAMAIQGWLSPCTLTTNFGSGISRGKTTLISFVRLMIGRVSLRDWDMAMYSAVVVESAISVCSLQLIFFSRLGSLCIVLNHKPSS